MCRGRRGESRAGGEQRGSGDGAGHFAENVLKAAVFPGLLLIMQTHFVVLLKTPALRGNNCAQLMQLDSQPLLEGCFAEF